MLMVSFVLFCAALSPAQAGSGSEQPEQGRPPATAPAPETSPVPASVTTPPPDRWLLMKLLQGTWAGTALDGHRMQVTGWIDLSFTASTDTQTNLPLGFNHRANDFLLQQNWLRFER